MKHGLLEESKNWGKLDSNRKNEDESLSTARLKDEDAREDNILVASWINDLGHPQKEMEVSFI